MVVCGRKYSIQWLLVVADDIWVVIDPCSSLEVGVARVKVDCGVLVGKGGVAEQDCVNNLKLVARESWCEVECPVELAMLFDAYQGL